MKLVDFIVGPHIHRNDGAFRCEEFEKKPECCTYGDGVQVRQRAMKAVQAQGWMKGIYLEEPQGLLVLFDVFRVLPDKTDGSVVVAVGIDNTKFH
jgi:hypothetical protein